MPDKAEFVSESLYCVQPLPEKRLLYILYYYIIYYIYGVPQQIEYKSVGNTAYIMQYLPVT